MPEISANGVRFHYQVVDQPGAAHDVPTFVFVHGLIIDNLSSFYYSLAGPTLAAGFRGILYDLRGHGRSERPDRHYSTADSVADLCALLDALGVTEPVYLVGNSYGGVIAARMAVTAPERVAGLVLIEASCVGAGAAAWLEDMTNTLTVAALGLEYDRMQDRLLTAGQRKSARMAMHANALLNGTSLIDDLAAERPLDASQLASVSCPVLGIYGEYSELVGDASELQAHVPDCVVEILPGVAHTALREATGTVWKIVTGWLPGQRPDWKLEVPVG